MQLCTLAMSFICDKMQLRNRIVPFPFVGGHGVSRSCIQICVFSWGSPELMAGELLFLLHHVPRALANTMGN